MIEPLAFIGEGLLPLSGDDACEERPLVAKCGWNWVPLLPIGVADQIRIDTSAATFVQKRCACTGAQVTLGRPKQPRPSSQRAQP